MQQMREVLMIGGCADGERRFISPELEVLEVVPPEATIYQKIALASEPSSPRYFYNVHRLHERGQDYYVAVWQRHDRPVIKTLIDGYRPK